MRLVVLTSLRPHANLTQTINWLMGEEVRFKWGSSEVSWMNPTCLKRPIHRHFSLSGEVTLMLITHLLYFLTSAMHHPNYIPFSRIYRHRERNKSCRLWHKEISAKKVKQVVLVWKKVSLNTEEVPLYTAKQVVLLSQNSSDTSRKSITISNMLTIC